MGLGAPDDAAVWRLGDGQLLIVTTDFFTPVVDDPYDYGSIAAANALSDLYAMGAKPRFALNILAVPTSLPSEVVSTILRGGAEKVLEAGAVIAGGHSVQDDEPKYGLVAIGMGTRDTLMTKAAAKPGDILVLSKPLGTGVTTTALKNGVASDEDATQAITWMKKLNEDIAEIAKAHSVQAATDITGFGLIGHGLEMTENSGVALSIFARSVPFLKHARDYVEMNHVPGGSSDNQRFFGEQVNFQETLDPHSRMLLFDAQTSGGLLVAVPASAFDAFMASAENLQLPVWPIGRVEEGTGINVIDDEFGQSANHDPPGGELWYIGRSL